MTVRCSGRGCPFRTRSATARHVGPLARRLVGTACRPGDRLLVTVSAPGRISERARVTIRDNRKPLAAAL
ncbi:MAG TPA: hypothetical protein VHW96_11115 [Solirubrobacteraceae bacterium]|nr:hypothetical protein [Solirubrobacteraceae bacterium]